MLPRVLLLSAVVIWGWTFVATKILLAELGPVEIFALRLVIGAPFLGGVLIVKRVPLRFARIRERKTGTASGRTNRTTIHRIAVAIAVSTPKPAAVRYRIGDDCNPRNSLLDRVELLAGRMSRPPSRDAVHAEVSSSVPSRSFTACRSFCLHRTTSHRIFGDTLSPQIRPALSPCGDRS